MDNKHSRAPKLLGDFGEGLVTYTLIRKGFEVAFVDHVGADLIAEKDDYRIAVSECFGREAMNLGALSLSSAILKNSNILRNAFI